MSLVCSYAHLLLRDLIFNQSLFILNLLFEGDLMRKKKGEMSLNIVIAAVIGLVVSGIEVDDIKTTSKTLPDFEKMWAHLVSV